MRVILLIMIGLSSFVFADFTKSGDIVTDNQTGLQWQDNTDVNSTTEIWTGAIDYCENLMLDGYSDWRLPNINELKSIVDRSKISPAIVDGFTNIGSFGAYWSSTRDAGNKFSVWAINFGSGTIGRTSTFNSYYVRCVRAGQ